MIFGNRKTGVWKREPNEFARRLEISDIRGLFRKHITIEHGTQALFLQGGRFTGELPPGTYKNVGGVIKALKIDVAEKATVILVDVGDVALDLHIENLSTNESVRVGMGGNVTIQADMQELNKLFINLMKGRELLEIRNVEKLLEGEMKSILQAKIKDCSVKELYGNLELKKELEQDFEHQMKTTLERTGLKLVQLPSVEFEFPEDIEEIIEDLGKLYVEGEKVKIEKERLKFEKEMAEIEKERSAIDNERKRDSIGTTLTPLHTHKEPAITGGKKLIKDFSDQVRRRRRGEELS